MGKNHKGRWEKLTIEHCKDVAEKRGYEILDKVYINAMKKLTFVHVECGCEFQMQWNNFSHDTGCPKCNKTITLTVEFCKEEALKRGYQILDDEYINNRTKLTFVHQECDYQFKMIWANFSRGYGCPRCALEKTECAEATALKKYYRENFSAIEEYNKCKNPTSDAYLPFDIYLPKENIYIEVHGKQHYNFVPHFHITEEGFEYQQYKDNLKREFARANGTYVEIDTRLNLSIQDYIDYINSFIQ